MYAYQFDLPDYTTPEFLSQHDQSSETQELISKSSDFEDSSYESSLSKEELLNSPSKYLTLRASTAPPRPLTDLEEFRRSSDFLLLEHTVICSSQLFLRSDQKYDLDSDQGQRSCKKLLNQLEKMSEVFKVKSISREYRSHFSKAYRVLYKENSLCYLTEILDSAQEGFPYLYVNSEKYVFSSEVLEAGGNLFSKFTKTQYMLKEIYNRVCDESFSGVVDEIKIEIQEILLDFDSIWVDFEQLYVHELMAIESDARRFIEEAIWLEKELTRIENSSKILGKSLLDNNEFIETRAKLVVIIGKINSVANIEGKGRDDLTVDILKAAEVLIRRMSTPAKCVKNLAEKIKQSFLALRLLFRKYSLNIEIVDPQLKNNPDLVNYLVSFESSWERGKIYFLNSKKCNQLVFLSNIIESTSSKFTVFREQLECSDSELFVNIPALIVIKALEEEDRGICKSFCSPIFDETESVGGVWKRLKRSYKLGKLAASSAPEYLELITLITLGEPFDKKFREQVLDSKFDNVDSTINKIKYLAIELHRHKPADWNRFLDIILC